MKNEPLLEFRDVSLGYGPQNVLSGVCLAVRPGDFLGVLGPNGSGKTTLLRAMLGLIKPRAGSIERRPGIRFGYVPQRQSADEVFPLTVWDVVSMGRYGMAGLLDRLSNRDLEAVQSALEHTGIADLAGQLYRNVSGGQKQRALIARALAAEPDVLVLDEPTSDMDLASEASMLALLDSLASESGLAVILVSHLLHVVAEHARTVGIIDRGRLLVGPIEEILTSETLRSVYGIDVSVEQVRARKVVTVRSG